MAIGESRRDAKITLRNTSEESLWTVSSGKIHSHTTRKVYQQHVLHFINWCRSTYQINRLDQLDEEADELACAYLTWRLAEGRSAYTIQAERAALRLFFRNRDLAATISLPERRREQITRSRRTTKQDRHFQPNNWMSEIHFLKACGLRRSEARDLFVREIYVSKKTGYLVVYVRNGKGGLDREVRVLPGHEQDVLCVVADRSPDEHVFNHLPKNMDIHSYRQAYARSLYLYLAPGRSLPQPVGRLKPTDYDEQAVKQVSEQLGHHRVDVVLRHYLR
jgi:hypothetical protein